MRMREKAEAHKRPIEFEDDETKKKIRTEDDESLKDEKIRENSLHPLHLEHRKGRNKNLKNDAEYVELLKKDARRKYLKEREREKLDVTKKLLDDELLYSTIKLEGKELKELELSKRIYDIAKENIKLREKLKENYYLFQEDLDKFDATNKGTDVDATQVREGKGDPSAYNYDEQIINKGILKFGSGGAVSAGLKNDFVFEDDLANRKSIKREESEEKRKYEREKEKKKRKKEKERSDSGSAVDSGSGRGRKHRGEKKRIDKSANSSGRTHTYRGLHKGRSEHRERDDRGVQEVCEEESRTRETSSRGKKRKKGSEHGGEHSGDGDDRKRNENGLTDVVEFVHLDSFYGMDEKERELQRLFEDIKRKKEKKMKKIIDDRKRLPIFSYRYDILKAIKNNKILILVGETGSGKSTQLTQYLHECKYHLYGNIVCTQPRRIACIAIANRVADEMNVKVGKEVGYVIRFQNKTSESTKIVYMTDGMFLRLLLYNPTLDDISVLIIDEAHERALHTDVILPIVKDICNFREDIRIIISSATLDAEKISTYFNCAPIFYVPGRKYNVDIYYTINNESNYLSAIVITILQIHVTQEKGDILVFLPGQFEIELVQQELENKLIELAPRFRNMIILPIYSSLPVEQQARIFEDVADEDHGKGDAPDSGNPGAEQPDGASSTNTNIQTNELAPADQPKAIMRRGTRKIILSTNICETSITIDNIVYVIDSGLCKQKVYNPNSGIESLVTLPCSKASVNQRTGRAGRKQDGKCFRLFTKKSFIDLNDNSVPEIQRCEVSSMILLLKSLGMDDIINFDFLDPPSPVVIIKGLELLYSLGALNDEGNLTKTGRKMAEFPTDVKSSKMILAASEKYNCVEEILCITAMLTHANNIFYVQKGKEKEAENVKKMFTIEGGGDFLLLLNIYKQCEENNFSTSFCYDHFLQYHTMIKIKDIKTQLVSICEKIDLPSSSCGIQNHDAICNLKKCIVSAFFTNAALPVNKNELKIIKLNQVVSIYPSSVLAKKNIMEEHKNACIIFYEVIKINKSYIRHNIPVTKDMLYEIASFYFLSKIA
ncbi:pre-mRNA-splicing factor ATP-dependent RNA helicase PRP2, putative [Plasmodium knowlesi strain H]|uniref:RNA helicase n=3 Tax=Plasmodium knowlesi TaxID=5850 RepID=A0A5K1UW85_PLAKH|nr:pre-mRNA-splicing factor ATP-dependent RNA helicase PRP2, putative [Plasmodium knowlesi strain H]OTN63657.1 putative ATP-dependent RNA helicase [Plasmodium knowlesi]CAA9991105.1 pre-mRNA-splicing factor ATP-dependent RNA helicase PRP2, putative [Plasmodium knowlesi strain H]SBO20591.1 pre-mRNA-splicing factor ATP-dependent RNA helicase PRP2, putative [Plasmodium knowlesi strain H]SBO20985.1 pre-mRNA-splicing factor ATP-dependent RNA helicase PRP2, putative [Plasmodium knowlesi strain H]VVS8|eukprot:XP_002262388.1 ATP-dependent RNA helicase, putative [Plasmodium knowlesi strain H]